MKIFLSKLGAVITAFALTASVATADPPTPITADQAFEAVQMQIDPETGMAASVALIDVRDPVEYFFTGAPADVTKIVLIDGEKEIFPDLRKVRLLHEGKFIEYRVNGRYKRTLVDKVSSIQTQALALNIPFWLRTPTGWDKTTETAVPGSHRGVGSLLRCAGTFLPDRRAQLPGRRRHRPDAVHRLRD